MTETELTLLQAAMDTVAEKGLDGFSMKQVTNRVGLSEALLYKYFVSKENLLLECFLSVNQQIAGLFANVQLPPQENLHVQYQFVYCQWVRYFRFMVENGSRSLFYYAYRDSSNLQNVLIRNNVRVAEEMEPFVMLTKGLRNDQLSISVPEDYIWLFLLESTGAYVKYAIRNQIPMDQIDIDSIWRLISGGLIGLLNH